MMVRVDQARHGHRMAPADGAVRARQFGRPRSHLPDLSIFDVKVRVAEDGVLRVHENQGVDIADEQGARHSGNQLLSA